MQRREQVEEGCRSWERRRHTGRVDERHREEQNGWREREVDREAGRENER